MSNYTYLLIDVGTIIVPLIYSFHKKIQFVKQWKALWPAIAFSALVFVAWDMYYTNLGVWGFNAKYLTGLTIYNLPIEEILFFICVPYSSVFTYYCFEKFNIGARIFERKWISPILILFLLIIGSFSYDKLYTGVTFIALALLIGSLFLLKKTSWIPKFYFTYLVILLPFFIVNGLLTGTGLDEPVVWYNNSENMGIRILTIPVEDIFYGMLLLMLNTLSFEVFRKENVN